jgi:hypothetical protein
VEAKLQQLLMLETAAAAAASSSGAAPARGFHRTREDARNVRPQVTKL